MKGHCVHCLLPPVGNTVFCEKHLRWEDSGPFKRLGKELRELREESEKALELVKSGELFGG